MVLSFTGGSVSWSADKAPSVTKLVLGYPSWPGVAPVYIGKEKGFFKENGIDLEIKLMESMDSRRSALTTGQIDIDGTTLDQLLIYAENKVNAQAIGLSDYSTGGDGIIAKKSIATIKDLRGKTVAYGEASVSEFLLRYLLDKNGMSIKDIVAKPVADAQIAGTAVIAGQVDAAVTYEPWISNSKENAGLHILVSTKDYPSLIPGPFAARKDDIDKRPNLYRGFMKAWFRSVEYLKDHPEESEDIMSKGLGISKDELKSVLSGLTILGRSENEKAFNEDQNPNLYELTAKISRFWKESGFVSKEYSPKLLLNPQF